jgi:hypothetical protein
LFVCLLSSFILCYLFFLVTLCRNGALAVDVLKLSALLVACVGWLANCSFKRSLLRVALLGTFPAGCVPNTVLLSSRMALQAALCCTSRMLKKGSYRDFPYGSTQASEYALDGSRMTVARFVVLLTGRPIQNRGGML